MLNQDSFTQVICITSFPYRLSTVVLYRQGVYFCSQYSKISCRVWYHIFQFHGSPTAIHAVHVSKPRFTPKYEYALSDTVNGVRLVPFRRSYKRVTFSGKSCLDQIITAWISFP